MTFTFFDLIERILINKPFFKEGYLESHVFYVNIDFRKDSLLAEKI